ncbi:unnamed protein product [Caenorhabditis sp. 36 PRJEB53466]|nr:unnamed protein product [Caenorhabditis sp. 36 PRJEB53466]
MLENVVAWVLNNYIGEYLEDLNTDQLSVALLSGQVELENVPLKKTALRKLDLPLEVKSGLLGKLTLSVPITHLRSEPWTLKLSDVLIIVGPLSSEKRYDVEAVEQVEQQRKEQMLDELELRHKTALLDLCGIPLPESQDSWWGASLISTVLNNIQLILNNVHIRYEDNSTIHGQTFNCGIRIQKMTMQTTNAHWKPGFAEPQKGVNTFKKLELTGFSIYWNSKAAMTENIDDSKQLKDILAPETSSNAYIIQPCSAELRMEKNSSKFPLKAKIPRFKFFMRPDIIACELTRHQMTELRAVNREWARFERARQHRKWRPLCTIGENAKEWWRFAYNRVLEESRRANANRTWEFAHERAARFNAYCRAYRKRLVGMIANPNATQPPTDPSSSSAPSTSTALAVIPPSSASSNGIPSTPSAECHVIMKQIERDSHYTYHELHLFRETVFRRLLREKELELGIVAASTNTDSEEPFESLEPPPDEIPVEEPTAAATEPASGGLYGWITGFFGQAQQDEKPEDNKFDFGNVDVGELKENVKEMEEEILDVLHESWDDVTLLRRDALLAQISLRLEHLTLRFVDGEVHDGIEQQRVLALELSGVSSRWELSPKQHYISVDLTVNDMSVQRLRSGHPRPKSKLAEITESLLYSTAESTKMLLTVGRDGEDAVSSKVPMFSMHYSRKAPRLIVRHTVNCRLRPVSIVYEEGALDGLSTLFTDDPTMFDEILKSKLKEASTEDELIDMKVSSEQISIIESHVFVNLELPAVRMEVRGRGWTKREMRPTTIWEPGEPIACLNADRLNFSVVSREQHLTILKLVIGHVEMRDMIENTVYPLLTTTSQCSQLKTLSNSCPDFLKADNKPIPAKSSKSSHQHYPGVVSSSVPDHTFPEYAKPLNLMTITSATSVDNPPVTGAPTPPIPASGGNGGQIAKPEVTIKATYVDKQHAQFERKYKKVSLCMQAASELIGMYPCLPSDIRFNIMTDSK